MDTKDLVSPQGQSLSGIIKPVARRRFSKALKREMVEATFSDKTSVSIVARRYDVNANQLFRWRKQYHQGLFGKTKQTTLLPIKVNDVEKPVMSIPFDGMDVSPGNNTLEIILSKRHRVVINGNVCQQSLLTILQVLS